MIKDKQMIRKKETRPNKKVTKAMLEKKRKPSRRIRKRNPVPLTFLMENVRKTKYINRSLLAHQNLSMLLP